MGTLSSFIRELLQQGYDMGNNCSESDSFVELRKRNSEDDCYSYQYYCNLPLCNKSGEIVECTYATSRVGNMERHIQRKNHHEWKGQEGWELMLKRFHKNSGLFLLFKSLISILKFTITRKNV
jgi:hypothetical protein